MTEIIEEFGQSRKGNEPMPEDDAPYRVADARAGDARARDHEIVTGSDGNDDPEAERGAFEDLVDLWMDEAKRTLERLWGWLSGDRGLLREHPADIAALATYWVRAPMAGHSTFLRWVQRIHGFTIGAAGTAVGYSIAWLCQRPLRSICFLLLTFIVWRFR